MDRQESASRNMMMNSPASHKKYLDVTIYVSIFDCTCSMHRHPYDIYYVSPLYTEGETYRFTSHRSFLCHVSFVSVRSVLSVYHAGGQTRDVEPALAQYCVTVTESCLTPRLMWASVTNGEQTLTQLLFKASCWYYSQHEVGLLTRLNGY